MCILIFQLVGVQRAIAARITTMAGRNVQPPVVFTGGFALVSGMDAVLKRTFDKDVTISPDPQMTGTISAAILASRQTQ